MVVQSEGSGVRSDSPGLYGFENILEVLDGKRLAIEDSDDGDNDTTMKVRRRVTMRR